MRRLAKLRVAEFVKVDDAVVVDVGGYEDGAQLVRVERLDALAGSRLDREERELGERDDAVLIAIVLFK